MKARSIVWLAAALAAGVLVSGCSGEPRLKETCPFAHEVVQREDGLHFRGATLSVQHGIPVLTLTGTPYENGLAYGTLLGPQIRAVAGELEGLKRAVLKGRGLIERLAAPAFISHFIRGMRKRIPPEYLEELRGVAEGSGVPEKELVFAAAGAGVFSAPGHPLAPAYCTSTLTRLPDRIVHGRNFDFGPAFMASYPVVVHHRPPQGTGYWSFGVAGYLPSFHGINERGISVTLNYGVASYDPQARGMPVGYKVRELLRTCATLEEAERAVRDTPSDEPGWIFTLESADEQAGAVMDTIGSERAVRAFDGEGTQVVLNRLFSYTRHPDGALARKYLYLSDGEGEYNVARAARASELLASHPIGSVDDLLSFLRDTSFYGYEIVQSENASIANDYTLHTLVFDWKERKAYFARGVAYASLHEVFCVDLATDRVAPYRPEAPRLGQPPVADFLKSRVDRQLRDLAHDFAWIGAHTDYATVDPLPLLTLVDAWEEEPSVADPAALLSAADRLIGRYPDYCVPHAVKARILRGTGKPAEAVRCYRTALSSRIVFVPNAIGYLAQIADISSGLSDTANAAAAARECLALIERMKERYALDAWVVQIEKRMRKRAARAS